MIDSKLEEVRGYLRATVLKINAILDDPNTTKSFVYINSLNFTKNNAEAALKQIAWLEDNMKPSLKSVK